VIRRQVGCSGYRIDLALVDLERPGRFLLGIECDGAIYHSSATARDRDRLRQEVLESLGWTIIRIWSTDWVKTPQAQVERIIAAVGLARGRSGDRGSERAEPVSSGKLADEAPVDIIPVRPRSDESETTFHYEKIDEVPNTVVEKLVLAALGSYGATGEDELKQAVTRRLGFKRTGKNISSRLDRTIESLIRTGKIVRSDANALKLNDDQGRYYA
jgi:very-short-patch-repair endonuclease